MGSSSTNIGSNYRHSFTVPLVFRCTFSGTICDAMRRRGWIQCPEPPPSLPAATPHLWTVFFCDMAQFRELYYPTSNTLRPILDYQRIGHFRNVQEISRKNLLVKNLKRFRARLERCFGKDVAEKCNFMPETYVLPFEHAKFMEVFQANPDSFWIIKPAAGAQGRGIFIVKTLQDYVTWRTTFNYDTLDFPGLDPSTDRPNPYASDIDLQSHQAPTSMSSSSSGYGQQRIDVFVVQKYITNPYLIGGRKFDIRFYVLVTSFLPLRCYMYREGFARFSAGQFSLDALQDIYVHLTNVAIQKTSKDYNPDKGSKWSLQSLREYLTARHGREKVQSLFNAIDHIVIRTLQSAQGLVNQDTHCFEVYGFDVIIDRNLKPWLLEVNASPAFTPSNEEDYVLKIGLIDDTVTVLDLEARMTKFEKRIGGYDLLYNDGPVYANATDSCQAAGWDGGPKLNSYLGCKNDRIPQLRDLHRSSYFLKTLGASSVPDNLWGKSSKLHERESEPNTPRHRRVKDIRFAMPELIL